MAEESTDSQKMSREELVEAYSGLVYSITNKLRRKLNMRISSEDLEAYGFQGLMMAYDRFDPSAGTEFASFAYHRIRGAILDGCRTEGWVSRHDFRRARALSGINEFTESAGEEFAAAPAPRTLSESIGRVSGMVATATTIVMVEDNEDVFVAEPTQGEALQLSQDKALLKEGMRKLSDQEREVLVRFYFKEQSMKEIGQHFGHTKSWVSRIHTRALETIRDHIDEHS